MFSLHLLSRSAAVAGWCPARRLTSAAFFTLSANTQRSPARSAAGTVRGERRQDTVLYFITRYYCAPASKSSLEALPN